jgi:antitoxin ParD1/3/4
LRDSQEILEKPWPAIAETMTSMTENAIRHWCIYGVILHHISDSEYSPMPRQSISLTDPSSEWLRQKVEIEGEYRSNSEAVNDLIRKAREIEGIQARLIRAEQSGFTDQTREELRAEIRKEMQGDGELQDQ